MDRLGLRFGLALVAFVSAVPALAADCRVWTDPQGVHHAWAGPSRADAFACFGYVHGRNRAFQLDWLRRTFQGRKAEVAGFGDELRACGDPNQTGRIDVTRDGSRFICNRGPAVIAGNPQLNIGVSNIK